MPDSVLASVRSISFKDEYSIQMKLKIKKKYFFAFFSTILFKIVLDFSYLLMASRLGDYVRLDEMVFGPIKLMESYLLLLAVFVLMPKEKNKLSNVIVWLLVFISYIPILTLYAFMDKPRIYVYAIALFWPFVFFLLSLMPRLILPHFKKTASQFIRYFLFAAFALTVIVLIRRYLGFFFNFDLTQVYDIRAAYVNIGIPFAGYLFTWFAYVVNPAFFAIFYSRKRWFWLSFVVILQFILFSVTGIKLFLFSLLFAFFLIWLVKKENPLFWLGISFSFFIFSGIVVYLVSNNIWLYTLFTRRLLFVPAQLSFFYYDFFSNAQHLYLSGHAIFNSFSSYPYVKDAPSLICDLYFGRDCNANNGLYADAYMNFGFAGFVVWGMALAVILKVYDSVARNKPLIISVAVVAAPIIMLNESFLLTVLITHGIVLSFLILYLLPQDGLSKKCPQ